MDCMIRSNPHGMLLGLGLALALCPVLPARELGYSPAVHELVDRVRRQAPTRSLLDLGLAHFRIAQFTEAAELFTFALMHDPEDGRILWALARTHARLGNFGEAKLYLGHLLQRRPDSRRARILDRRLDRAIESRAQDMTAATTSSPPMAVVTAPAPAEAPSTATEALERQRKILACQFEDKLACLRVLKGLDAALAQYKRTHPKAPLKTLDLEALRKEKILPTRLRLRRWMEKLELDGETVRHKDWGSVDKLEEEVGAYRDGLIKIARHQKRGETFEAYLAARRLAKAFPDEGQACRAQVYAMTQMGEGSHALERLDGLVETYPDDPALLYRRALLQYRMGKKNAARRSCAQVQSQAPKTYYARLAREIVRALDGGISFETLETMLRVKASHFAPPKAESKDAPKTEGNETGEAAKTDPTAN